MLDKKPRVLLAVATATAIGLYGAAEFGHGVYIFAKARLAQSLLAAAWARSLREHGPVAPWPWADTYPVGRLRVPRLGVDQIILAGASGRTLAFGPGHVSGSGRPGGDGAVILSGHRDTHFRFLRHVRTGDVAIVTGAGGEERLYRVRGNRILDTSYQQLAVDPTRSMLTLVTCYPFDALSAGGSLRYIIQADPIF